VNAHHRGPALQSRRAAVRDREGALLERLTELGTALDGEPDPGFRATTRARLVAMAAVRTPAEDLPGARRPRRAPAPGASALARWRGRLTAGLAGAAVAVTALAALVAVSSAAQPGDPLYGLKRGTEQTRLALAGDATRGRTLLGLAGTRLDELTDLLAGSGTAPAVGADPQLVVDTLRTMDRQTADGTAWLTARAVSTRADAPLDELVGWAAGQSAGLSAAAPEVPAGARGELDSSQALLAQVGDRGTALLTALKCPGGPATSGTDVLGPLPVPCTAAGSGVGSGSAAAPPAGGPAPATTAVPGAPGTDPTTGALPTPGGTGSAAASAGSSGNRASAGTGRAGAPSVAVPTVPGLPTTPPLPSVPVPLPLPGTGVGNPGEEGSSSPPLIDTRLPICIKPLIC
jgi:hypothetical protein